MSRGERLVIIFGIVFAIAGLLLNFTPVKEITISNGTKPRAPLPLLMIAIGIFIVYCVFKMHRGKDS